MKPIALYLPQYHEIKENSAWWGEGYTEWTAVKKATPLFKGHQQPRIPLNDNYYDLADETGGTWKWQADLANKFGVYGFCVYHYWFNGKQLLEKPLQILLKHSEIPINFCVCWANESWTKTWYGLEKEILMKQEYGQSKDWESHFFYLLPFFKDNRYIKVDNKPLLCLYKSADIHCLSEMLDCWRKLAIENGFPGLHIVSSNNAGPREERQHLIDAYYDFQPGCSYNSISTFYKLKYKLSILAKSFCNFLSGSQNLERIPDIRYIYKAIESRLQVLARAVTAKPTYPGAFPMWDNTPRRNHKGYTYKNASPDFFRQLLKKTKDALPNAEFVFLNAWNEWGEGCYLEPDTINRYEYLEAIRKNFS